MHIYLFIYIVIFIGGGYHQSFNHMQFIHVHLLPQFYTTHVTCLSACFTWKHQTTRDKSSRAQRGRQRDLRPLRSREAPMYLPSVKQTSAGPSHGSMRAEWNL